MIKRKWLLFKILFKTELKFVFAYRVSYIMSIISTLLSTVVIIFLWGAVYKSSDTYVIAGFDYHHLVMYYLLLLAFNFGSDTSFFIVADEVRKGTIAIKQIRPVDYHEYLILTDLATVATRVIIYSIPVSFVAISYNLINEVGVTLNAQKFLATLSLSVVAALISHYIVMLFASLIFRTTNSFGIRTLMNSIGMLLTGALIPIAMMPEFMQNIIKYTPYQFITYIPTMTMLNDFNLKEYLTNISIAIMWLIFLYVLFKVVWNKSMKKVVIQGG